MSSVHAFLDDLNQRGLIQQMTGDGELLAHLDQTRVLYCGFDPTADSLHIGSLVPLLTLRRFQLAGHSPIALVGGATGLIGDPSFKAQERKLNSAETVGDWTECLKQQISQFIDFDVVENPAKVVNNLDWTVNLDVLTFLRDVGKHFSVGSMIQKDSVKQRLHREGEGISYTEFTYMLLQSYDFAELYKNYNCTLQIGGSDQWGNITGGIDLTRRMYKGQAYGLTLPLVTKSDGSKFGKTEAGTIWLDAKKTSPYAFYQFWLNTADADVYKFLKYFTFLSIDEIHLIEKEDAARNGKPEGQIILAKEVTRIVHGEAGLQAAIRISNALFSGQHEHLSVSDYEQLKLDGLPSSQIIGEMFVELSLVQILVDAGMASTGKQIKDALGNKALSINGSIIEIADNMNLAKIFHESLALFGKYFLVKLGKKKYHLFYS